MATTVGTGDFTYEVAEGWGELPEGFEWGQMGSVNTDSQDRVHIFTRTTNPVMVFDATASSSARGAATSSRTPTG